MANLNKLDSDLAMGVSETKLLQRHSGINDNFLDEVKVVGLAVREGDEVKPLDRSVCAELVEVVGELGVQSVAGGCGIAFDVDELEGLRDLVGGLAVVAVLGAAVEEVDGYAVGVVAGCYGGVGEECFLGVEPACVDVHGSGVVDKEDGVVPRELLRYIRYT